MVEKKILIVEDDLTSAVFLQKLLTSKGYEAITAKNGKEALAIYMDNPVPVVITDIAMPVMDGNELISRLQKFEIPPIIFVTTVAKEPGLIIDIMQKGVYNYIIKPVEPGDLLLNIKRAFEAFEMKRTIEIMEREKTIKLEKQLEWYKWEDRAKNHNKLNVSESLFQSLKTNFNQGAGFGVMITLINLIASSARKEGDSYVINAELFDIVKTNADIAEKALQAFSNIEKLNKVQLSLEKISYENFYDFVQLLIEETKILAKIKNQKISLSEKKIIDFNFSILLSKKYFREAFNEVLINAYKFSKKNSNIIILINIHDNNVIISVVSEPQPDEEGRIGIPMEYENIVFEPFVRLTKSLSESYKSLNFGLGLTIVEKIISKHGGKVSISNISDNSDIKQGTIIKVHCSFSLPLAGK